MIGRNNLFLSPFAYVFGNNNGDFGDHGRLKEERERKKREEKKTFKLFRIKENRKFVEF